mmetsp:Transcript_18622/g.53031  ORF Transcript_18622/g.53031 Transcript_18622/m.53031 type:complete len:231 (+) Transcript_18622:18289-18981(+)
MCSIKLLFTVSEHMMGMSPTKPSLTALNASLGQPRNQSIAHPVMSPGNFRARSANFALTGEKQRTTCKFLRTVSKKNFTRLSGVSTGTDLGAYCWMSDAMIWSSSFGKRPGISPVMSRLLSNSKKFSSLICESVKMNVAFFRCCPAVLYIILRSSRNVARLYCFVSTIWKGTEPAMYEAKWVRDCLPEPPTPTSIMLPRGMPSTLEILTRCNSASSKITKFICLAGCSSL